MITTILIEHPWLSPTAMALLVLLGPPIGRWLTVRPRLAVGLLVASVVPVLALTLVPTAARPLVRCAVEWSVPTFPRVELAANVVLLVAPALLAVVVVGVRRGAATGALTGLVGGSLLSVLVETVQALVPAIGRSCSTNDWLSNTIGAAIGALLGLVALAAARRWPPRTHRPFSIAG